MKVLDTTAGLDWHDLVRLPDEELERLDIAAVNVACAAGLPGCSEPTPATVLQTIDGWTAQCRRFTDRVMPMLRSGRSDYPESEPKFRIQALITHLQRDLGVRYHPGRMLDAAVFEPRDSFLQGIFTSEGGTCGSMPVLYTAVGRRLGYPLELATTKRHLYCRWDDGAGEAFNIEGAGEGISFFPDEHYRTGRYEMSVQTVEACGYLVSHSAREALAGFLVQRGECWRQERNYNEALTAYAWAHELAPVWNQVPILLSQGLRLWDNALHARLPAWGFPKLDLGIPAPQFRHLSRNAEKDIIRMRVMEGLLNDPAYERRWWKPLRSNPGVRPLGLPDVLRINYRWNRPGRAPALNA